MTNQELFQKLSEGDLKARDELIVKNAPLVNMAIRRCACKRDSLHSVEDYHSIGTIGLIRAVDTFDTEKKNQFSSYAMICILNAIRQEFRRNNRDMVSASLDSFVQNTDEELTIIDTIEDPSEATEKTIEDRDLIRRALEAFDGVLCDREKEVLRMVIDSNGAMLQRDIGIRIGMSQPNVSRTLLRAQKKLREACGYGI